MSRAFVKEQDDAPGTLTERPVSGNPNGVAALALLGRAMGEFVEIASGEAEILALEAISPER